MKYKSAAEVAIADSPADYVPGLIRRARDAMAALVDADQQRVDEAVTAIAWALYKPEHAQGLARRAVETTEQTLWRNGKLNRDIILDGAVSIPANGAI